MAIKQTAHIIRGLRKDFSDSKQPKEYAIDAKNIRITNREDSSLLSITNEKGTKEITLDGSILGKYLGHTVINEFLVLFTRDEDQESSTDYIYKIDINRKKLHTLFSDDLGFEGVTNIEALGVYETKDIQKVYWVDGVNQPRVINIAAKQEEIDSWTDKSFDFIQELQLNETISVEKSYSSGSFNSGVIQYAFNYYNKNGQESNIVEVTPINYISYEDRGAAPNDYVSNSFKITINNYDKNFDYLRLYSIHRTSLDAVPSVKIVADINLKTAKSKVTVNYIDTGIIGETIDPVELLYKGGEYIIPKTLAQKDGTLFFGNIKLKSIKQLKEAVPPENVFNESEYPVHYWRTQPYYKVGNILQGGENILMFSWEASKIVGKTGNLTGYYPYKAYLNKGDNTTYKSKETYRLGIQFQENTGKWSEPIFYNDIPVNKTPILDGSVYKGVTGKLYISKKIIEWAKSNNYKKVRPVVVYPQESEREVIAQGIVNSTLSKIEDRLSRNRTHQSSWFFRPNIPEHASYFNEIDVEYGAYPSFKHGRPLPNNNHRNAEIQSSTYSDTLANGEIIPLDVNLLASNVNFPVFPNAYVVDKSLVTMHSPELEHSGSISNFNNLKFRIVGYSTFDTNMSDINIICNPGPICLDRKYFYNGISDIEYSNRSYAGRSLISGLFWKDGVQGGSKDSILSSDIYKQSYLVYPWHGDYINNQKADATVKYSILKEKKMSNLKFSLNTTYLSETIEYKDGSAQYSDGVSKNYIPLSDNVIFEEGSTKFDYYTYDSTIDTLLTWPAIDSEDTSYNYTYYSNVDGTTKSRTFHLSKGFPIITNNWTKSDAWDIEKAFDSEIGPINIFPENSPNYIEYSKSPIRIKYKSSPHAIIYLGHGVGTNSGVETTDFCNLNILPIFQNEKQDSTSSPDINNIKIKREQKIITIQQSRPYLWLAELYREVPNKFGGDSYENNIWYPAGDSVRLNSSDDIYVEFTQGDTFFARFDSLKTYPYTLEDTNSIVEIGSFMVETRINLDARYDRNRGKQSNLVMNPGNFNLFNDVYNQKNNFFNYRIIDKDIADNTKFPNTIVWSKQKFAGADIDAWTNINMASSLDLDGTKGELTKLVSFKNEIFSFQPEAINHILFNSRVQIPTSDGVPIELSNAYKVDGARQLSSIGSSNPLAIKSADRGIYYMDNITKGIYVFNGQQSESLSDKLGMSSWVKNQNIDLYRIDYDKINQDVYFIGTDNFRYKQCLGYSEKLGEFESFFDYNDSEIFNVKDGTYAIKSNKLYKLFEGDYNNFFDNESKPFWVTFTHNENPFNDKIYNTLEFRADTYNYITKDEQGNNITTPYWDLSNNSSFDIIKVDNEYQDTTEVSLEFNRFTPSNLKRKFRIWRANIPRDFINKRDRIRNTWANITLKASNPSNTKTELHDLVVSYFM